MNTRKIVNMISVVTSILAFIMLFFTAIVFKDTTTSYTFRGTDIIFGRKANEMDLNVSILGIILFILTIAMIVISIVKVVRSQDKKINFLLVGIALVATIIFFIFKTPVVVRHLNYTTEIAKDFKLGVGAVLGGIFSILTAVLACADYFLKNDIE